MCVFSDAPATAEIYTLSLHDALPICTSPRVGFLHLVGGVRGRTVDQIRRQVRVGMPADLDRKSTRLNSSHANISYAVFCLKKKTLNPEELSDGRNGHAVPYMPAGSTV